MIKPKAINYKRLVAFALSSIRQQTERSYVGIVQGMSGSPILRDKMLAGVVTYVLVNDPTRGYGIFTQTMLQRAEGLVQQNQTDK